MPTLPRPPSPGTVLTVLVIAELTCAFESSMIYAALAGLLRIYGDPISVGWLVTGFLLVSAAAAAVCSRLGDIYGRRRVLLAILLVAGIGSVTSGCASSLAWIIVGRAVQGASSAILPLCFGLARERLPQDRIAAGIGIVAATSALGAAFGYVLGGVIVDHFPWQTIFWLSAGLAAISWFAVWRFLDPGTRATASPRIDVLGGLLFVPAVTGLVFAISRLKMWGWTDARLLGLAAGSLVLLILWVRHEWKHPDPLIDVRLFLDKRIARTNLGFAFAAFGAMQAQLVLMPLMQQPQWTQVGLGASATTSGLLNAMVALFAAGSSVLGGRWAGRWGGRPVMVWSAVLMTAAWIALTAWHGSMAFVVGVNLVGGMALTCLYATVPILIVQAAPIQRASEATGMSSVIRAIAGALGAQAIAYALSTSTVTDPAKGHGTYPSGEAYAHALLLILVSSAACWFVAWRLPRGRTGEHDRREPSRETRSSHAPAS